MIMTGAGFRTSVNGHQRRCISSMTLLLFIWCMLPTGSSALSCYKCESHRDFRCLDPFDYRPHISVLCDLEPYVRDRNPVFCEKVTELVNGVYVTTRGCSTKQWEDLQGIIDHRGQNMRCIRNRLLESCYCTGDNCNTAIRIITSSFPLLFSSLSMLLLVNAWM